MATGVLPICVGSATKAAFMAQEDTKIYRAGLKLGVLTATGDITGEILQKCKSEVARERFEAALSSFLGNIEQIPPMYSAVKQNGQKLYELARKGVVVDRKPRAVTVFEARLEKFEEETQSAQIFFACSKGTYIRTLCEDIGKNLGSFAAMTSLRRLRSGPFSIENARTLSEIEKFAASGNIEAVLLPTDFVFSELPRVIFNQTAARKWKNGVPLAFSEAKGAPRAGNFKIYEENGQFLSVACMTRDTDGKEYIKAIKNFYSSNE